MMPTEWAGGDDHLNGSKRDSVIQVENCMQSMRQDGRSCG